MTTKHYSRYLITKRSCHNWSLLFWTVCSLIVVEFPSNSNAGRSTSSKIYEDIEGSVGCFRRLNGTHQAGCSSSLRGDVGVLHVMNDDEAVKWVTQDGPHSPYIAAVYPNDFNQKMMVQLRSSGRVSGVLILNSSEPAPVTQFSADLKCPNQGYGLSNKSCAAWNAPGSGLMHENIEFPIFFVNDEEDVDSVVSCFDQFNKPINGTPRDWPLCAAQLKSFMLAAIDTPTCLRRSNQLSLTTTSPRVCDPLGDLNLWAPVLTSNQSEPNSEGSVIVIAARFDGSSMFDGVAPGADSAVTGFVTLLTVLKQLSSLKEKLMEADKIKNVYFMLFQGEAFDYIGSSRMAYDMKNGKFPPGIGVDDNDVPALLNLTDIKYFIELNQVALQDSSEYFIHESSSSDTKDLSSVLVVEGLSQKLTLTPVDTSKSALGFPPSSLQSFLLERPNLPGIVVTNHEKEFKNKFYNSIYDDAARLKYKHLDVSSSSIQTKLANLATTVSNTVLKLMLPNDLKNVKVEPDPELVDELLHCYLEIANCTLFQTIVGHDQIPNAPYDLYVGVHLHYKPLTYFTKLLMMYFQGSNVTSIREQDKCKRPNKLVEYQWINGSCYESSVNASAAHSPAFLIENYDWASGKYSTWTESVWQKLSVRIFLKPSRLHEILTLVFGIMVFAVSFVIVGWVSSKADVIFPNRPTGMAC